jgi:hypothetical protein
MIRRVLPALFILLTFAHAQSIKETDWQPSLADGGAPDCSEHVGIRTSYSATVHMKHAEALIIGTATRGSDKGCSRHAELVLSGQAERKIPLPLPHRIGFGIADFSPDGRTLLLASEREMDAPYEQTRNVEVAVVNVYHPQLQLINVWDVFGWEKCEATVEPQGFTRDGRVLLLARPSIMSREVRNDCVRDWGLYATDLKNKPVRLPDDTKVPRFAEVTAEEHRACRSDPDIVGACFTVHGKLRAGNGSPSLRIWRTGTKRILGVLDDYPLPDDFDNYDLLNGAAWGDFEVCPFTKDKPGEMRMVCVDSARHLNYQKYRGSHD